MSEISIISGDKFAELRNYPYGNIIYLSWDELWEATHQAHLKTSPYLPIYDKDKPFILITHQGDPSITNEFLHILESPNLIHWYALNASISHPKLTCIPCGIEYRLSLEKEAIFKSVMAMDIPKTKYISTTCFAIHDWVEERKLCADAMAKNGIILDERRDYKEYLISLKQSRFCPCPVGNGIDNFRFWECQYLGVLPITSASLPQSSFFNEWLDSNEIAASINILNWEGLKTNILIFQHDGYYNAYKHYFNSEKLDFNYWKNLILQTK